jgi:AraC-like DNA-binding protein
VYLVVHVRSRVTAAFYGGRGFSLYHAYGKSSRIPLSPHFHDEYLICAQLRGDEHCHVGGRLHEFRAGDLALINPGQVHTGNNEGDDVEYVSLYVESSYVAAVAEAQWGNERSPRARSSTPEFTVVRASSQPALVAEIAQLLAAVQRDRGAVVFPTPASEEDPDIEIPARRLVPTTEPLAPARDETFEIDIDAALLRVVTHAFEEFSNLRSPAVVSTHRIGHHKIARALEYLRSVSPSAAPDELSLDRLAAVAELSKFHFLRQFDQVVGMTPGAYLRTLRMCQAARMLRTSDVPIVEIATTVGFADHPSFSRAFARHMGLTPSEYRRAQPR